MVAVTLTAFLLAYSHPNIAPLASSRHVSTAVNRHAWTAVNRQAILATSGVARASAVVAKATTSTEIIPREVLFGNPEYASPTLSPDGKLLSYLAPDANGVLNVWCRTLGDNDDRVVTSDTYRGIRQAFWAEDSSTLLFMQDNAGDENFHLFAIDATSPDAVARDLTPYPEAKAQNVITNKRFPETVLVAINNRDPSKFDMYRCDLATGALKLDTENPGSVVGWGTEDESFEVREALVINQEDSSSTVRVRDSATSEWRELINFVRRRGSNSADAASALPSGGLIARTPACLLSLPMGPFRHSLLRLSPPPLRSRMARRVT